MNKPKQYRDKFRKGTDYRCPCGRPSTRFVRNGHVCERCFQIEESMYGEGHSSRNFVNHTRERSHIYVAQTYALHLPGGSAFA